MINKINEKAANGLIFKAREINLQTIPLSDCHLHTSWTDGKCSVLEVYEKAISCGLKTILFSEHSRKTSVDWFPEFANEVRKLPSLFCKAYVGTEVKVETTAGDIDTNPEIADQCDFVMASVHRFIDKKDKTIQFSNTDPKLAVNFEYDLSWAVLSNTKVDILGHMFGMSYKRFNQIPSDEKIRSLIKRASEFGVAVEINSHYHPNIIKMIEWCKEFDANICFGSNAHSLDEVGMIMHQLKQEIENYEKL